MSWQERTGALAPFPNSGLSENCRKIFFLSKNFHSKMQNLRPKTPSYEKNLGAKLKL